MGNRCQDWSRSTGHSPFAPAFSIPPPGFSAAEWLPILEQMTPEYGQRQGSYRNLDWSSIMLYPSGAGGIGDAAPPGHGQEMDANDHRQPVLLRLDGQKMHPNYDLSERDVSGIKKIYDDDSFPQGLPVLPNDSKSKHFARFKKIWKKDKC